MVIILMMPTDTEKQVKLYGRGCIFGPSPFSSGAPKVRSYTKKKGQDIPISNPFRTSLAHKDTNMACYNIFRQ